MPVTDISAIIEDMCSLVADVKTRKIRLRSQNE